MNRPCLMQRNKKNLAMQLFPDALDTVPERLPILSTDVAEPILALAIRHAAILSMWNPASIAQPLNALPRSAAPLLTKVALMHLPHVDLDAATKLNDVDLLRFMLAWSKQPGGRPVNYKSPMGCAFARGHTEALDWWLDESGLVF
ncbi:hypothetical protein BCR44DRAFT_195485 [Catenaria anguillulae PL171]|uniref:Uncharacterized protein n=1 Tax=Catenaria anguillulae PL171 TaxID=765915 RepID=A0A1Y2HMB6_9FUNG|nr:hypothetical protein BCR44DRAFT_195485 [Catenaria anguillulae PL171]